MAAEAIGYGAIKYFDLRQNPTTDYIFSYERMLDVKGDTAVYLLQQHARISSVITKSKVDIEALKKKGVTITLKEPTELGLAFEITQLSDVIFLVLDDVTQTHRICEYLYKISTKFSEFWTNCKVIENEVVNESRLLLCEAAAVAMRQAFKLLGIKPLMQI